MNRIQYVIASILAVFFLITTDYLSREEVPDFAAIKDVEEKKARFFEYIYPRIENANLQLIELRGRLIILKNKLLEGNVLSQSETDFIHRQQKKCSSKYNDGDLSVALDRLLVRADIVPPSLALAQSANESAWGTSRFARHGSNYFGQWCYTAGCGIVPSSRNQGAVHEVRSYNSVRESVSSYINNINSASAYSQLRSIRASERARQSQFQGYPLAAGLGRYSERGGAYVKEIREIIRINQLDQYDDRFWRAVEYSGR